MRYFGTGYTGSGSKQSDMKEAAELFEQAAGSDNALSLNNMAVMLLNGVGVAKNKTKAFEYFNRSAALGNAWGINSLAACYINGNGVEANRRKGIELWQQAADMGNSQANFNLGIVYRDGNGPCPPYCKDHSKAYRHFDKV
jgi:TPR repeat protein